MNSSTLHADQVFLRREALDFGYDDRDLRDCIRADILAKVRHGAYAPAKVWQKADDVRRHQLPLTCRSALAQEPVGPEPHERRG